MRDSESTKYTFKGDKLVIKNARFKTADTAVTLDSANGEYGSVEGYFSTFDRIPDSYGDVIRKGAFLRTIRERKESGHPFPLLYNHDFNQIIGKVTEIKEDNRGAFFRAEFFNTARAQEVRSFCRSGAVYQFSFAYDVKEKERVRLPDGKSVNELRDIDLYEISIVIIPANPRAVMTDIKSSKEEKREELLQYIAKLKAEDDFERRKVLQYIAKLKAEELDY